MENMQIANEINSSQISPSQESGNDGTENAEENHIQHNENKNCATLETLTNDLGRVTMHEKADWICAEIQKIKEFQTVVERKSTKLELTNTTPVQHVELTTFNKLI